MEVELDEETSRFRLVPEHDWEMNVLVGLLQPDSAAVHFRLELVDDFRRKGRKPKRSNVGCSMKCFALVPLRR